jgi:hypothetical protein
MPTTDRGPGVRIFMQEEDFRALVEHLDETGWDHIVRWKIKKKWSEHLRKQQPPPKRRVARP